MAHSPILYARIGVYACTYVFDVVLYINVFVTIRYTDLLVGSCRALYMQQTYWMAMAAHSNTDLLGGDCRTL